MASRILTVKATVLIPTVPNYLMFADSTEDKLPLSAFEEPALREIGAAWTEALIARAAEQRAKAK